MKVKIYKNEYGYDRAVCPLCPYETYIPEATRFNPDRLRGVKTHIRNAAKNEALAYYLETVKEPDTDHLKYYSKHTSNTITVEKRKFDNDLNL